jgi:hypothetical protein
LEAGPRFEISTCRFFVLEMRVPVEHWKVSKFMARGSKILIIMVLIKTKRPVDQILIEISEP